VQRVAVARDGAPGGAVFTDDAGNGGLDVGTAGDLGRYLYEQLSGGFGRTQHHRSAAEDAGGNGALQRLGRGRQRHARRLHARHQAVLGDRDQRRVQHPPLRG
jgi:hypothetical protein